MLWLVPALPLLAFVLITAFLRRPQMLAAYVSILAIAISFVISLATLFRGMSAPAGWRVESIVPFFTIGPMRVELSTFVDGLGAVMLVVVTLVSMLVQIYSTGYMVEHGEMDPGFSRFFSYLSLFTCSMLLLVLANNFFQLFVGWELVGLCSYLLVGFWYFKPEAADAAKKAFITTRFGDLGFLIGILFVFAFTQSFSFADVTEAVKSNAIPPTWLTVTMVLLFCGAIGKSAQFPLHVWLPDAMEGPTPVSALIHAATMVAAGVYMVARLFELFESAPTAAAVVAWIGGITAIFAATHGLVMRDIKRVLAYSTVSQLGYMMMALGVGGLAAGTFHLTTHAFFKALLFLGSGSVIHGSGVQDMFFLGGLGRRMPITKWTFLVGSLALAGVFPFAGFWSKDDILSSAFNSGNYALGVIGIVTAFMTAFYIFRAYFLTFSGEPRPDWVDPDVFHGADAPKPMIDVAHADPVAAVAYEPNAYYAATHGPAGDPHAAHAELAHAEAASAHQGAGTEASSAAEHGAAHGGHGHLARGAHLAHESGPAMTLPLVVLAIFATFVGFVGAPQAGNPFGRFVTGETAAEGMNYALAGGTLVLALIAIFWAWTWYGRGAFVREPLTALGPVYVMVARRYYLDDLYNWMIGVFILGFSQVLAWFDKNVVDGVVNLVGWITRVIGDAISRTETGREPNYALAVFGGIAVIVFVLLNYAVVR